MAQQTTTARRSPGLSETEGIALIARWRSSGESMAAFARKNNILPHVVYYWATKDKASASKRSRTEDFFVLSKPAASELPRSRPAGKEDTPESSRGGSAIIIIVPLHGGTNALAQTLRSVLDEVQR